MPTNLLKSAAACLSIFSCGIANAGVVIPIDAPGKAFLAGKAPTMTLMLEAERPATATVVFIPGGDGRIGLKEGMTEPRSPFGVGILRPLTRSTFNLVVVDDPYGIDFKSGYSGDDRIDRIESVLKYYKSKLKAPMVLFGHSHGSNAVMRLVNRSTESHQLLSGIVLSSSRAGLGIETEITFPVLFVHHVSDECPNTTYDNELKHFEQLKGKNFKVSFAAIDGGETQSGAPCESGHHMYYKSYEKVVDALQKFLPK